MSSSDNWESRRRNSQNIGDRPVKVAGADGLKAEIIQRRVFNQDETYQETADAVGCRREYVWIVWNERNGNSQYQKESFNDLCENHQRVIKYRIETDWTQRKIANEVGIHEGTVSRVLSHNEHLLQELEGGNNAD